MRRRGDGDGRNDIGFADLVDRSPEPVAVFGDGRLLYANAALAHYLGYSDVGALAGVAIADLLTAHAGPEADGPLLEACWSGAAWSGEIPLRRRDGREVVALVRLEPLAFGGRPARVLFLRDVTERALASAALGRSEENFRTIIESSPLAMCVSRQDRLVYVNPALLEYLGYDG